MFSTFRSPLAGRIHVRSGCFDPGLFYFTGSYQVPLRHRNHETLFKRPIITGHQRHSMKNLLQRQSFAKIPELLFNKKLAYDNIYYPQNPSKISVRSLYNSVNLNYHLSSRSIQKLPILAMQTYSLLTHRHRNSGLESQDTRQFLHFSSPQKKLSGTLIKQRNITCYNCTVVTNIHMTAAGNFDRYSIESESSSAPCIITTESSTKYADDEPKHIMTLLHMPKFDQ